MSEMSVFDKANNLLEDTDYPLEIKSIADLQEFLNDETNRRFGAYEEIGRLYDDFAGRPDIDRYPGGRIY